MEQETNSLGKLRFNITSHVNPIATFLMIVFTLTIITAQAVQAQTYTVLHFFNGPDGQFPTGALTFDSDGTLYGTTYWGGAYGYGTVFRMMRAGSGWWFGGIYSFTGYNDGGSPNAGITISPNGIKVGTAPGGGRGGHGAIYAVDVIIPHICIVGLGCIGHESVLYSFGGAPNDGANPGYGNLVFDQSGNMYGATTYGGTYNEGVVFELTSSGGGRTETILHNFGGGHDGTNPQSGVILDMAGNVYGTTDTGGTGPGCGASACGIVYQLVPSNGGWTENVLLNFAASTSGEDPTGTLIMDRSGNLYGTTAGGGPGGNGTIFELSNGTWNYSLLYSFSAPCEPVAGVTIDSAGNLYGVCFTGGAYEHGFFFKLTKSEGRWTLSDLHDFQPINYVDGQYPLGPVTLDANGNIYGTTEYGGNNGDGIVWEYTP